MLLKEYLMIKASEEACEATAAFNRCLIEGVHAMTTEDGKTPQRDIAEEINDLTTFLVLLQEEGESLKGLGDKAQMDACVITLGAEIAQRVGKEPDQAALIVALLHQGLIATLKVAKAFTKSLTFGIDSEDPRNGLSGRAKIVLSVNTLLTVVQMLQEESVAIPGIGDTAYMEMRMEKGIAGANEARNRGLITDLSLSVEIGEIPNGGLVDGELPAAYTERGDATAFADPEIAPTIMAMAYPPQVEAPAGTETPVDEGEEESLVE